MKAVDRWRERRFWVKRDNRDHLVFLVEEFRNSYGTGNPGYASAAYRRLIKFVQFMER